jgi:hypothetical protein
MDSALYPSGIHIVPIEKQPHVAGGLYSSCACGSTFQKIVCPPFNVMGLADCVLATVPACYEARNQVGWEWPALAGVGAGDGNQIYRWRAVII